jgi:hypothetical protein
VLEGGRTHRTSLTLADGSIDAWFALLRAPQVGLTATADRLAAFKHRL